MNHLLSDGLALLFGTPLLIGTVHNAESLNAELLPFILAKEGESKRHSGRSGGWRSTADLLSWQHPRIAEIEQAIRSMILAATARVLDQPASAIRLRHSLSVWANVLRDGDYQPPHCDPRASWSGIYYVSAAIRSGAGEAGLLEFVDPRTGSDIALPDGTVAGKASKIRPVPGSITVFPGFLVRFIHPYQGSEPHVSIGFTATLAQVERPAATAPD
jgi:uncharacterized protein (TIGR02466 family)